MKQKFDLENAAFKISKSPVIFAKVNKYYAYFTHIVNKFVELENTYAFSEKFHLELSFLRPEYLFRTQTYHKSVLNSNSAAN